jgi:hypothetical protein
VKAIPISCFGENEDKRGEGEGRGEVREARGEGRGERGERGEGRSIEELPFTG